MPPKYNIMLKKILSISGKPGLYKLVSRGKNMLVVESLIDGKRIPSFSHERITSLGDIAMYTETDEVPLHTVLENLKTLENGAISSCDPKAKPEELKEYFAKVLPDFDRERVHNTDIKKLISWYNLLINSGNVDFTPEDQETETASENDAE